MESEKKVKEDISIKYNVHSAIIRLIRDTKSGKERTKAAAWKWKIFDKIMISEKIVKDITKLKRKKIRSYCCE